MLAFINSNAQLGPVVFHVQIFNVLSETGVHILLDKWPNTVLLWCISDARKREFLEDEKYLRKPLEFKEKSTKKDVKYSDDLLHNDLDESFDLSLTSDLDDLSLNTSLNLSDEIDTLSLDIRKRKF